MRTKMVADAERLIIEDAPIVPLYFYARIYLLRTYVKGLLPHMMDHHPMRDVHYNTSGSKPTPGGGGG